MITSFDLARIINSNPALFEDYVDAFNPVLWFASRSNLIGKHGYYIECMCPFQSIEDPHLLLYIRQQIGHCTAECYQWLKRAYPNYVFRR